MYLSSKTKRPLGMIFIIGGLGIALLLGMVARCPAEPPGPILLALNERGKADARGTKEPAKNVTLDFNNVDIRLVIKFMSDLLGKNFLVDDSVKGNVTIISPQAVPVDEAYQVFESILEVKGFAAIPSGSVVKIVPVRDAFSKNIETRTREHTLRTRPEDSFITQLIPINHADVNEVKNVISMLVSKESKLIAYGPTNTIILTETLSNIDRLVKIIHEIDIPTAEVRIEIVPLKYASPDTIAAEVMKVVGDQKVQRTRQRKAVIPKDAVQSKIIPDDRTGSLIILAQEDDMETIMDLINRLDIPAPRGKDNIRVRALKNSKAEEVAKVLSSIISQQRSQTVKGGQEVAAAIVGSQITADKATNSLIITASPQEYEILSRIIDELDVMRPQVLVEALIAEVTFGKNQELGVEWRAGVEKIRTDDGGSDYQGFGGTNFGEISSVQSGIISGDLPQGIFMGVAKDSIKVGSLEFPNIAALIRAYQGDQDVNILSTPHLLTTDNEEAKILIGQSISYPQSDIVDNVTRQSFIYKDVGLTLKITPYINPDGYVKLEISLKIDNVIPRTTDLGGPPWTTKREADTTVVVKDRQTVVIGGLLKDDQSETYDRVPCLGEIPLLGWLFRKSTKRKEKTNLQVFLTPHIIRTPEELQALTYEKSASLEKQRMKLDINTGKEGEPPPADIPGVKQSLVDEESTEGVPGATETPGQTVELEAAAAIQTPEASADAVPPEPAPSEHIPGTPAEGQ
ncbi:MAG: type II secretion system secretin GspD [bacterium]